MNLTQKLLGVASLGLALASISVAQTTTKTSSAASLLGVQYVEASFGYLDYNHSNDGSYALGAAVNAPIAANIDLTVGYSYGWVEGQRSAYTNQIGANLTGYLTQDALRPFVTGGAGYVWERGGSDFAVWNAGAGAEYSFNSTTALRLTGSYNDSFKGRDDGYFVGAASLSHWFSSSLAGTVGVSWIEGGNVGYGVSAIFKF